MSMAFFSALLLALMAVAYLAGRPSPDPRANRPRSEHPVAWRSSLEASFNEARAAGKMVVLDWTAAWCGICKEMDAGTYRDARVVQLLNERFVPVRLDWDHERAIAAPYRVRSLPTMQIFTPDRVERHRRVGSQSAVEMESFLRALLEG